MFESLSWSALYIEECPILRNKMVEGQGSSLMTENNLKF